MARPMIATAREMFSVSSPREYRDWIIEHGPVKAAAAMVGAELSDVGADARGRPPAPVLAYINEGRWVGDCPQCNASMMLLHGAPFLCAMCANTDIDCVARPVIWPVDEQAEIEAMLTVRPVANRNWTPGESVDLLRAESIEHRAEIT